MTRDVLDEPAAPDAPDPRPAPSDLEHLRRFINSDNRYYGIDYLADPAHAGRTLREADVAADVFGRELDLSGDASVRVYVHRLRKKLEDFYAGPAAAEPHRLVIPVGAPFEQHVWLLHKRPDGVSRRVLEGCRFLPLVCAGGFPRN